MKKEKFTRLIESANQALKHAGGNSDFSRIVRLIESARHRAFSKVNAELVLLYFSVGRIISAKVAEGGWGENTVEELAEFIKNKIPGLKGFNRRGLYRMKQFYETYTAKEFVSLLADQHHPFDNKEDKFVSALLTQISWTHHLLILSKTKTSEETFFYLNTAIKEKLSTRDFERQLNSALFERTMLANEKVYAVRTQSSANLINLFKDPYIFEFLDLPERHSENDLEHALIQNLKNFILEIGKGSAILILELQLQSYPPF